MAAGAPLSESPTIAVAESATGGMLMSTIVGTPGAGDWFRGGVVSYHPDIKYGLLAVPEGPVITRRAALAMAAGVASLLGADVGIGITGVAGPDEEEGQPVGTMFVGVSRPGSEQSTRLNLSGDPYQIRRAASEHAFRQAMYARKVIVELESGEQEAQPTHRLAVPEGGFALESRYPLSEASITGTRICFSVEGDHSKPATLVLVPLNGERVPEVLLSATNSEPTSHGRRNGLQAWEFVVRRGSKVSLTWNRLPH
jgi:PncC family amidohydrolase